MTNTYTARSTVDDPTATALARLRELADELTAEADLAPVGSDEYLTLHTIAARIRAATATPDRS
ncbi:hypothetical protein [Embleya hyalina]|uniref:Uncharacterized protein n=1 Tax=Embleya hyalina TaxID=516124 RepID=A0A401YYQ7_9ACTN|nr:hypothetical protein [Embleya hyalina]GCD99759.1 hypothetical protein EHYA_07481 [Embleya hyalina]